MPALSPVRLSSLSLSVAALAAGIALAAAAGGCDGADDGTRVRVTEGQQRVDVGGALGLRERPQGDAQQAPQNRGRPVAVRRLEFENRTDAPIVFVATLGERSIRFRGDNVSEVREDGTVVYVVTLAPRGSIAAEFDQVTSMADLAVAFRTRKRALDLDITVDLDANRPSLSIAFAPPAN